MKSDSDELAGFRKLYNFSRLLLDSDDPEGLLTRLVEATRRVTKADEVILFEIQKGDPKVRALASDRPEESNSGGPDYSETLVQEVIRRGSPLLLKDVSEDPRFGEARSVQLLSITSAMGAPLLGEGELKGIIYASRQRLAENFTDYHRELMTVAASQASLLMDRLAAMEALRESELRHRSLVETSPSTIAVLKGERLVFANQKACQLWGRASVQELEGVGCEELFDPWRSQALMRQVQQGEDFDSVYAWTSTSDGEADRPVEVMGRAVQFDGAQAMQLRVNEVNEEASIFAQRLRADRLMLMGTMAATMGHEINNPLSYVYTNLDFVYEEFLTWCETEGSVTAADNESVREVLEALESAREGTERIRAVVDSVQNFTRLDEGEEDPTTIEEPLKSSLRIVREKLSPEVELQLDVRPTAPVPLSAAKLGQVLLNVLVNAAHALGEDEGEEEGRLEVRTREIAGEVLIEVADNGPGIGPEIRHHIFEPFVSTKDDDIGTGLGLSICREIVDSADGSIEVESDVGKGSLFRIILPALNEIDTQRIPVVPEARGQVQARVLVVDPEPTLGRSLQRVLQDVHDVTAVHTTGAAVDLLAGSYDFDVILCDLRLRGGVGRDLFGWVEENALHYWDRLVAMTASRVDQRSREYLDGLPNPWIAKPFDINRLRAIIESLVQRETSDVNVS